MGHVKGGEPCTPQGACCHWAGEVCTHRMAARGLLRPASPCSSHGVGRFPSPLAPGDATWDSSSCEDGKGQRQLAAASPSAQLGHSPACSTCTSVSSSGCRAGLALTLSSSSIQAFLGMLGSLPAMLLRSGLKGSHHRDGKRFQEAPKTRAVGMGWLCRDSLQLRSFPSCPVSSSRQCGETTLPAALISQRSQRAP